jgi:hypothetical protein
MGHVDLPSARKTRSLTERAPRCERPLRGEPRARPILGGPPSTLPGACLPPVRTRTGLRRRLRSHRQLRLLHHRMVRCRAARGSVSRRPNHTFVMMTAQIIVITARAARPTDPHIHRPRSRPRSASAHTCKHASTQAYTHNYWHTHARNRTHARARKRPQQTRHAHPQVPTSRLPVVPKRTH